MLDVRYAFDIIGEVFFGAMFGFMENRCDYGDYILTGDLLLPVFTLVAIAPTYLRPIIQITAIVAPSVRRGLKAMGAITQNAKNAVAKRAKELSDPETPPPRRDLLQQEFDLMHAKGEKVDFGIPEIETEAWVAL